MRFQLFFILILVQSLSIISFSQDSLLVNISDSLITVSDDSTTLQSDTNKLVIVFAGDIMGHDAQIEGALVDSNGSYNYEPTFRYVKDYLSAADIAIGNLEVTLAGPVYKGYPQFSSPDNLAIEAKKAGFGVFVTANNHALDRGYKGMERTIKVLDSLNIIHAGTYLDTADRDARYPLIIEKKGIRLAILNYTYGTNGLKVKPPYIVNRIDKTQISKDIEKAKLAEPDYIICAIHWGIEYQRDENRSQQDLAQFMFNQGVDAIIGSHPHVVQPIKMLSCSDVDTNIKCPVIYSMGNFVSNQRAQYKDGGVMAELHLSKNDSTVVLDSFNYMPYWVYREEVAEEKYTFYVVPVPKYEQNPSILDFTDNDLWKFNRFKNDTRSHLKDAKESDFYQMMSR